MENKMGQEVYALTGEDVLLFNCEAMGCSESATHIVCGPTPADRTYACLAHADEGFDE